MPQFIAPFIDDPDLWDRANRLLQSYADCLDRADCSGVAALFAEDGRWDHGEDASVTGRDSIRHHLEAGIGRFVQTHHQVGPASLVRLADGSLQSTSYFIATHVEQDGGRRTVWGRYVDRLAEGTPLLIANRRIVVHLSDGTPRAYHTLTREPLPD